MPKSKKTKKKQKLNQKINYYIRQSQNVYIHNSHSIYMPYAKQLEQEDFSKDLLDIGDSSNNFSNPRSMQTTSVPTNSNKKNITKITAPKLIGQKIPVKMREDIIRKHGAAPNPATKQAHIQSNQILKDCLSSDIKTVVKDNIKTNEPSQQMNNPVANMPAQHPPQDFPVYVVPPRGVPRSFLTRPNQTVIEPQLPAIEPQVQAKFIPTIQRFPPVQPAVQPAVAGQPTFAPIPQDSPQAGQSAQAFVSNMRYSPTDLYSDLTEENKDDGQDVREDVMSPDLWQTGEKRASAFDRLGPLTQPKTPKLTINLSFNKDQSVREVVGERTSPSPPRKVYVPVHERKDILHSTDDTVMKYVGIWPWAKVVHVRRMAKSRGYRATGTGSESSPVGYSPTAMMMLKEQMDEIYQRDNTFLAISVTGYPASWTKEDVLDAMLDNLKGKSFVPCFIEFNDQECKFLVIRSRGALLAIHALDFHIQKDAVQLSITISHITLTVMQLDFIPRLILRKRLANIHCKETMLNLSAFTLQPDVSHFIYYPLNQLTNQVELMKLQTDIIWSNLTELDLSHNRLTTVEGFDLENRLLKLRHLDLSHNYLEQATLLLCCRKLSLHSLKLEGNPLCHNYIDPHHYVTVLKMMFPTLRLLDGIPIQLPGDFPAFHRNYCLYGAEEIINNFLQLYIPLLDSNSDNRVLLSNMYAEDALVTITYRPKFGFDSEFRYPRNLLLFSRVLLEGSREFTSGRANVEKLLKRWPKFEHDPSSFTIDVMLHTDNSTLFRLDGIVKLPADSLAENDQLVAFSRTVHLHTSDGVEYKIKNEMLYWDEPTEDSARAAFRRTLVKRKPFSFKLELPLNQHCKKKLIDTLMNLTQMEEQPCTRCLELKHWNLREALDHFIKLYKINNLEPLMK